VLTFLEGAIDFEYILDGFVLAIIVMALFWCKLGSKDGINERDEIVGTLVGELLGDVLWFCLLAGDVGTAESLTVPMESEGCMLGTLLPSIAFE
jgi:hypothetical protein